MNHRITGTTMPVLEFALDHNDAIISEAGELSWMSASIQMTTHTQMAGGGGFFGAIKRVAGGGSLFMTEYRAMGAPGEVAFATRVPGHIVPLPVGNGYEYLIHAVTASSAPPPELNSASASSNPSEQESSEATASASRRSRGREQHGLSSPAKSSPKTSPPANSSASTPATSEAFRPASPSRSSASPASRT